MGWSSGTEIFDRVTKEILKTRLTKEEKEPIIQELYDVLTDYDWDCECDSEYYNLHWVGYILGVENEQ